MAWFRIDDGFHGHPKTRRAGLEAIGLWTVAGSWAMHYKTDGFVPQWFVDSWPKGGKLAERLMHTGKWEPDEKDGEQGWSFHDWDDYQMLASEIEHEREKARQRQRARRARTNGHVTP